VQQKLEDLAAKAEGRDVVCSLSLTGRGPMHTELVRPGTVEDMLADLRAAASESPWVWVESIFDRTRVELDLDSRESGDDFLGAVLRRSRESIEDPRQRREMAAVVGEVFTGRRNGLAAPTEAQVAGWTDEARWHLAELLEPEE
jgi:hypothetical protein